MDNYLMLNGKRIDLTPEQYEEICRSIAEPEDKDCFERVDKNKAYYCMTNTGCITQLFDLRLLTDNSRYYVANYCTDKAKIEQRAMWETLSRLLWRFSEQNGGSGKWCIGYNRENETFVPTVKNFVYLEPTFKTEDIINRAIDEIVIPFMKEHPKFKM